MSITQSDPLFGVEIRHLIALATIAKTGSFSQAARELGYAQSAVSQQIAALERAAGHRLLERPGGPRPVTLTQAGELVLRHADSIAARLGAVRADLDALSAGSTGTLRVGVFQSASARLLPLLLPRFRAEWPGIDVRLNNEDRLQTLHDMVLTGAVDLSFSEAGDHVPVLESAELLTDPYIVLVAANSPLAHLEAVSADDLAGADLIMCRPHDLCARRVTAMLESRHVETNVVFRTDDNLTIQRLVGAGLGYAVVPRLTVEPELLGDSTVMLPLTADSHLERRIELVWHRDRYQTTAAQAFVAVARAVTAGAAAQATASVVTGPA